MAIQWITPPKNIESTANPATETHRFTLIGTSNKNDANAQAMAATPAIVVTIYGMLFRNDIQCSQTAYNQWSVQVSYGTVRSEVGEWTWDFDTTGGNVHIRQAKEEVGRYPAATAPNQLGAIAVDDDEVKGVEIIIPAMKINVQYKHPQGVLTIPYARFLASITGTVNSTPMLTFSAGEVLFLGARGSDGESTESTVTYSFAMTPNATGLTIGGVAGVSKKGWEVAWIRYEDTITVADGEDQPTRVPKFVYVDRVYDTTDLASALGFGG